MPTGFSHRISGAQHGAGGAFQCFPIIYSSAWQPWCRGQLVPSAQACKYRFSYITGSVFSFRKFLSLFLHLSGIVLILFCLLLANTAAYWKGRKEGGEYRFHNHRIMGRPTQETGGGTPQNHGLSEFKPLAKERGIGWGVKKEAPKQQPADADFEASEQRKQRPRRSGVAGGEAHNETYRRLRKLFEKETTINDNE
jgi:hypothetical protein